MEDYPGVLNVAGMQGGPGSLSTNALPDVVAESPDAPSIPFHLARHAAYLKCTDEGVKMASSGVPQLQHTLVPRQGGIASAR